MAADFCVSCGHTEYSNIRFEDKTRHMVIFEAAHDLPELENLRLELPIPYRDMPYRVRLFQSTELFAAGPPRTKCAFCTTQT